MELITTKNAAPERRETTIRVTIHLNCNATYVNVQISLFLNNVQFLIEKNKQTTKPFNEERTKTSSSDRCMPGNPRSCASQVEILPPPDGP